MTKVFISYSRKDKPFAKKLVAALNDSNLDSWIDWDDIPPTADWLEQIHKGIEESDGFLFLLSPDSVESDVCRQEIDHAIKNGKRLIPLVVRDVVHEDVHPTLAKLNWVFFRERDDFAVSLEKLQAGITTDLEWVEAHRRLQVRALEWEKRKDRSLLLRGGDLREAEERLATSDQKTPQPTDLQRQYLLQSRRMETKSRNNFLRIGFVVIFALTGLLLFALAQLNSSRAQQLGLAAQAAYAEGNYNTAAVYAYQATQFHQNDASDAVFGKLPYQNYVSVTGLLGHPVSVKSLAWSADNRLASISEDNTIILWDLTTGQPGQTFKDPNNLLFYFFLFLGREVLPVYSGIEGYVLPTTNLAWSPDGQLASVSYENTINVWDVDSGQITQVLGIADQNINSFLSLGLGNIAWSGNGQLASVARDGNITIWDLDTGEPAYTFGSEPSLLAWSQNGLLAYTTEDGIKIWDAKTRKVRETLSGNTNGVLSLAWSPNGSSLASLSYDKSIIIWNLEDGEPAQELEETNASVLAWSLTNQLASGSDDGVITLWDLETGAPDQQWSAHTDRIRSLAWSPDGRLASASDDDTVIVWNLQPDQLPAQTLDNNSGSIKSLALSPDGELLAAASGETITLWDLSLSQPKESLQGHTGSIYNLSWSHDGRLASIATDNTIMVWDVGNGELIQTIDSDVNYEAKLTWSNDGRLAATQNDNKIVVWDLKTGQPAPTLTSHTDSVTSVSWAPDGRIASSAEDGKIILWDLASGQPETILENPTSIINKLVNPLLGNFFAGVSDLAWSPDGELASASRDNTIVIWDVKNGRPAQTLRGHKAYINDIVWSADGQLATASFDNTVIVWDLQNNRPSKTLEGHTASVNSLAWLDDGRLASASDDGTIRITNSTLTMPACDWLFRNMTGKEWVSYQGVSFVYKPACPNLAKPNLNNPYRQVFWRWIFATWKGRAIIIGLALFLSASVFIPLVILYFIFRFLYKLVARIRKPNANS